MLNTDRIRLMTKLAIYEQGEGKDYKQITKYYPRDYVSLQMIKTFICVTIAFLIMATLYIMYHSEELMENLYELDFARCAYEIAIVYVAFVAFFEIITWVLYSLRYKKARKKQKVFGKRLDRIQKLRKKEEDLEKGSGLE